MDVKELEKFIPKKMVQVLTDYISAYNNTLFQQIESIMPVGSSPKAAIPFMYNFPDKKCNQHGEIIYAENFCWYDTDIYFDSSVGECRCLCDSFLSGNRCQFLDLNELTLRSLTLGSQSRASYRNLVAFDQKSRKLVDTTESQRSTSAGWWGQFNLTYVWILSIFVCLCFLILTIFALAKMNYYKGQIEYLEKQEKLKFQIKQNFARLGNSRLNSAAMSMKKLAFDSKLGSKFETSPGKQLQTARIFPGLPLKLTVQPRRRSKMDGLIKLNSVYSVDPISSASIICNRSKQQINGNLGTSPKQLSLKCE